VTLNSTDTKFLPKPKNIFVPKERYIHPRYERKRENRKKRKWDLGTSNSIPVENEREKDYSSRIRMNTHKKRGGKDSIWYS
jgi:hypothetical protein